MAAAPPISPITFAQQVKDRIALEQLIGEYVPSLTRVGTSHKGLCPFHKEKTASFYVHPERGFYHCFGCGAHGDALKFIQEIEKIDFMASLELLTRRAGLTLPSFRGGGGESRPEHEAHLARLRELCAWAGRFFVEQLHTHPRGPLAYQYLRRRGLSPEEITRYGLGYSPEGYEVLLRAAERQGYRPETVAEAGLASHLDSGSYCDRFRDRVMFPIADRNGQLIAFAGRLIEDRPESAKYINSAETPIFHKSSVLYGFSMAREAIKTTGGAVLLEGYMDWLTLHRHGIEQVLAGMGTALTEDQARLIKRHCGRVTLLYDGDAPGQKAMARATELLLKQGLDVYAAVLPAEHDPDTYLAAHGTAEMRRVLEDAPRALDYFITQATARPLTRPEDKAQAVQSLAPLLLAVPDPVTLEGYLGRAAQQLGLRLETLEKALQRRAPRVVHPPQESDLQSIELSGNLTNASQTEQNLLFILLQLGMPWELIEAIDPQWFQGSELSSVYERIYQAARDVREGADPPSDPFELFQDTIERHWISHLFLLPSRRYGGAGVDFDVTQLRSGLPLQCLKLKKRWLMRQKQERSENLQLILADEPLGHGQLQEIEALSRETIEDHARFLQSP